MACAKDKISFGEFSNSFEDSTNHVRVTVSSNIPLEYGVCFKLSEVEVITNKFYNPGSFDYKKYMRSQKIIYGAKGIPFERQKSIIINLKQFRQKVLNRNCDNFPNVCSYVNALIFGNNEIDKYYKTIYGQIGIAPIFAISGMHITLIYEMIIYWLSKMKVVINRANVIALIILLLYSILAGSSVAINRALMMIFGKLVFKLKTPQCFVMALFISLIFNPYNLLNSGYLLSYCLTAAIIFSPKQKFDNANLNVLSFSIFCYLIALPLSYKFNYSFNLLAPLAMIIFVPLITTIIMPLAFIVSLWPIKILVTLLNILVVGQNNLAELFDYFTVIGGKVPLLMWILYLLIVYQLYKTRYKYIAILVVWFLYIGLDFSFIPTVTFIDVGQGDSAVIEFANQKYLIDTGDQSSEIVQSLRYLGINKLDGIFISHAHKDHYGAISEISQYVDIEAIYELANNKIIDGSIGINQMYKNSNFTIIPIDGGEKNNQVLIVKFETKNSSVLFTGDIEMEGEKKLTAEYCNLLNSDIIKVPHHGSKSSSSQKLLECASPEMAIISSGRKNRYNHPDSQVVEEYQKYGVVYNTQVDGQISFKLGNDIKKTSN